MLSPLLTMPSLTGSGASMAFALEHAQLWQALAEQDAPTEAVTRRKPKPLFRGKSPLKNGAAVDIFDKKAPGITLSQYRARMQYVLRQMKDGRPSTGLSAFMNQCPHPLPVYASNIHLDDLDDMEFVQPKVEQTSQGWQRTSGHRLFALVNERPAGFVTFRVRVATSTDNCPPDNQGTVGCHIQLELREVFACPDYRKVGLGDFLAETCAFVCLQQMDTVSRRLAALGAMATHRELATHAKSVAGVRFAQRILRFLDTHGRSGDWHLSAFEPGRWQGHIKTEAGSLIYQL